MMKKHLSRKLFIVLFILSILPVSSVMFISASAAVVPAFAELNVISASYQFDESEILNWLDTGQSMKNLRVLSIAGEPLTPYRVANILLPPHTEVDHVSVVGKVGDQHIVDDIPCGQPVTAIGEEPKIVEKNPTIYNSDRLYPREIYRVGSVESFRGYNILDVRIYPVQYKPASKLALYYKEMNVKVKLKEGATIDTFRNLVKDREAVENLVDNPAILSTYDSTLVTTETLGVTYEYIIVTTPDLADEFQVLADWKANFVDGAKVVTVNVGANETEIKDVINDYYTNYGTSYVLLGGDVDVITYHTKTCTVDSRVADIAEDYWFANLDGDDEISYYEVYIGRAPVDNEEEVMNFVNKVIAYEHTLKPKANLFHQSRAGYGNIPDSRELAWQCEQYVPSDYTNYELFEDADPPQRIEKTDWINFWRNDGIMCEHMGHGSPTSYYINYEVGGGPVTWYDTDVTSMDNTFWPVHTSPTCSSGRFEYDDCIAEVYVKDPDNGAIACLFNDQVGLYTPDDATRPSGDFIEMQFKGLYQEGIENVGAMLAYSKHCFIEEATNTSDPEQPGWEWCWREINLIGDPETPLLTRRIQLVNVVENSGWETGDNSFWNVSTIQEPRSSIDYEVNQESECNSTYGFHVSMKTDFNKPLYTTQSLIESQPLRNALLDTNTKLKYLVYPAYELNGVSEIPQARWEMILFFSTGNKLHYYGSINMEPTENSTDKYVYMPITLDQWNEFFDDSVLETYIGKFGTPPIGTIITEIATYVASKTYATKRNKFNLVIANFDSDEDAGGLQCSAGYVRNVDTSLIYTSIQEAIDTPVTLDGHTISVQGVFHEHVVANKSLTLKGMHPAIIDGGGTGNVITLQANNFTISKFTIQNGQYGIRVESNNTIIRSNTVSNNGYYGIFLENCKNTSVIDNTVSKSDSIAIYLIYCNNVSVSGNTVANNTGSGIFLYRSINAIVSSNMVSNNKKIGISGIGITIDNNMPGLGVGNHTVVGNIVVDNYEGIRVHTSRDNVIIGNTVSNNGDYGIYLYSSRYNNVTENWVSNNEWGILISSSLNNTIYHNNIIDNIYQAYSSESPFLLNKWDDGYPSGGNYWSDYTGVDSNEDGLGDAPYVINQYSQDSYPLIHPWGSIRNVDTGLIYLTIQKAIDAPETLDSHTIEVKAGTYCEHVVVDKSLTLIGEDPSTTIIDGNGTGSVVRVTASQVNISGFMVRNGEWDGIYLYNSDENIVADNRISAVQYGIYLYRSQGNTVTNNVISDTTYTGIYLKYNSHKNTISNNTMSGPSYGIHLWDDCHNNTISNNNITKTTHACIYLYDCKNTVITDNLVDDGVRGIYLSYDDYNTTILRNTASNNWCGIYVGNSEDNLVVENMMQNNTYGIYVDDATNNTVLGNTVSSNERGIRLSDSEGTLIIENMVENNTYGIHMDYANNNTVHHNNFINNTNQVYTDQSVNIWDDGYPSGGNYWSDYNGTDWYSGPYQNETSNDGIGDTPYIIDENNQDNYPLMQPANLVENIDTGLTYPTIQEGINAPETLDGHTIEVGLGTYYEQVVVNKSLMLKGIHANTAIIDGSGTGDPVTLQANNVSISQFTIQNGQSGIDVAGDNNIATGNVVSDCTYGILVRGNNNNVSANFVSDCYLGVSSERYSQYSNISGNTVSDCYRAGICLDDHNSYVKDNTISNTDKGIEVFFSGNVYSISGNTISNTSYGIWVDNEVLYISYNTISNSYQGIHFEGYGIEISCNTISNNDLGINFDGLAFEISCNTISNNDLGLKVISNPYSFLIIYHNNFIDNTQQALDQTSYTPWDTGAEGNYWSDYNGNDTNGDGIGDTPYYIDYHAQDNYPLMHPRWWDPIRNVDTGLIYLTIQEAIDASETLDGHTIEVKAGTYYENVVVNKSLTLKAMHPSTTIIDGNGTGNVVTVQANNVTISQFTIQNGEYGVYLEYSNNISLSGNTVSSNTYGIFLNCSTSNTVSNNVIDASNDLGVSIKGSNNNIVSGNTAPSILVYNDSNNNIISGNTVLYNGHYFAGILLDSSNYNTIDDNTVLNFDVFFGIYLGNSIGNSVSDNTVSNNDYGIILYEGNSNNIISGNTVSDNYYGIYIYYSSGNTIHHNNFINNYIHMYSPGSSNTWNSINLVGNYWDDYTGIDADGDGIGDTSLPHQGVDWYPLMWKWFPGDLDGDGYVGSNDLLIFSAAYGSQMGDPNYNPIADLDYDCDVDADDLYIFSQNYGKHDC